MKKWDLIIIVMVFLVGVATLGINQYQTELVEKSNSVISAEISIGGQVYHSTPLLDDDNETLLIDTALGRNLIYYHDGGVSISDADCSDHVCVQTGFINRPGEVIACLPHKLIIEITGVSEEALDGMSK